MQPPVNTIKLENPGYYCNSYTPPAPEHSSMMASGAYSKYMVRPALCCALTLLYPCLPLRENMRQSCEKLGTVRVAVVIDVTWK
jgi:hypothetical protein